VIEVSNSDESHVTNSMQKVKEEAIENMNLHTTCTARYFVPDTGCVVAGSTPL